MIIDIEKIKKIKACGNLLRIKIILFIYENKECSVTDIYKELRKKQPIISTQLAVLRKFKIVKSKINKQKRIYSINDNFIISILKLF
jgi:predicted transcriptional regulator